MKTAASIAALAALGIIAVNYQSEDATQLFLTARITEYDMAFMKWITEYGKSYGTKAELEFRYKVFKKNLDNIAAHNANDAHKSTVGLNAFSDYTESEWKRMLGYRPELRSTSNKTPTVLDTVGIADSIDWRQKGAVSPIKNQGQCGSCWAFSTTGSIEGAYQIKNGKLYSFSEQQLVDCDKMDQGCSGGIMTNGFKYAMSNPLMLEADYPYTAVDTADCQYDESKGYGQVNTYHEVPKNDADQLKAAINLGPVSVAIEADQFVFQSYFQGVITSGCGDNLDHGVLAVGYGNLNGQDYFLVKNSWGPNWGDNGYVRIAPDQCGITGDPSYPTM